MMMVCGSMVATAILTVSGMPSTVLFSVFASSTWTLFTLVSFDPLDFALKKVLEVSKTSYPVIK
jgi:hypothetical protein